MESWMQILITIASTILASSGFWAYFQSRQDKRDKSAKAIQDLQKQMLGIEGLLKEVTENHGRMLITLRGIGHDRICYLGNIYLERGYITHSEYENLHDQLYVPYRDMGGNGTAKKIMDEVSQLKIKEREP